MTFNVFLDKIIDTAYDVLNAAISALNIAKISKKDKVVYYDDKIKTQTDLYKKVIETFPQAVKEGRLCAYFQPKVDANTNQIIGSEALTRWKTQDGKLLSPGIFVSALEKEKMVCDLDFIILEDVCKKTKRVYR